MLNYPLATRVDTNRRWQVLEAGGEHVCGIADGTLLCWGANDRGQVSNTVAATYARRSISIVGGPATWSAVAAGMRSTCAIGGRQLFCWGANAYGQRGDGTQTNRGAPTPVVGGVADWLAVSIGDQPRVRDLRETDGVYCWGSNGYGQVGSGAGDPQRTPNKVGLAATTLAVGGYATCATTSDGGLLCWGDNSWGELGESNQGIGSSATPVVATATKGWTSVVASVDAQCGMRDGQVVCWGSVELRWSRRWLLVPPGQQ